MTNKIKNLVSSIIILSLILTMPISFAFAEGTEEGESTRLQQDFEYLGKIIEFVETIYVDDVTEEELIEGAMDGIFSKLDDYSEYYNPEEFNNLKEEVSGDFGGIGIHITNKNGYITVITPIEGTPGFRAGIKSGDKIVSVDDKDVTGATINEAVNLMRGEPGTEVKIGIIREGVEEVLYFDIVREIINVNPISYEILDNNIGYIKITRFNSNTFENITEALNKFDNENIEKIIIDLRNNPGGFLDEVVEVLRLFVPEGPIVHIKNYDDTVETHKSTLKDPKYELAVLVNEGSASASEIFAGAIKDTEVGTIIGTTTYGKGNVQAIYNLLNGGGIKITIAEYFTPNNNKVNGVGIEPDIVVENTEAEPKLQPDLISYLNKNRKPDLNAVGLDVLAAEKILSILGYNINKPDGVLDKVTFNAIKKFQIDNELYSYGILDFTTQDALLKSAQKYTKPENVDKQLEKAIEVLTGE
ncbi:S41 family peptidase [Caldisalinibacter kiritimatiensis]|uniref:Carboxyl-terminal protease n=1 Tax=Caldisalinibacter kiritimatiensis TaxID=1304284 RepID=R1CT08_9FIRM|nr:S41 family peptidase [Caldisalinibacter kiritimatiensis]EOD01786.1 carboxyl-terminal protease [Caldisalinibacter kiritimatiensis]